MKFSLFLALRYLKPKRTFISIITVISVLGVALGVGVLMVVIAVMSGFEKRIKEEWLRVEPPIHILDDNRSFFGNERTEDGKEPVWREVLRRVKAVPGVESASAFIHVVALAQTAPPKEFDNTSIKVDPNNLPPVEPPGPDDAPPPPPAPGADSPTSGEAPPPPAPAPGPQGDPAKPGTAAPAAPAAAESGGTPAEPPAAAPVAGDAPKAEAPDGEKSDDANVPGEEGPAERESVTGLDRTKPLAPVLIIGVDTGDSSQMDKRERRFRELQGRLRVRPDGVKEPSAVGEFDISGETIVLSLEVTRRLARGIESGPVYPGETRISLLPVP